jgi:DNA-binding XRE family transcriptional regulator
MSRKMMISESDLASLAKEFRLKAGKTKIEAGKELKVSRPTMQQAEENPEQSLTKLRIRIIEKYSPYKVLGPVFLLKRK